MTRPAVACLIPLPGVAPNETQAAVAQEWSKGFARMLRMAGYRVVEQEIAGARMQGYAAIAAAPTVEAALAAQLKHAAHAMPARVLEEWAAYAALARTAHPARIRQTKFTRESATAAADETLALRELFASEEWQRLAFMLAARAQAHASIILYCPATEVPFHNEARRQIVAFFTRLQERLDLGTDAEAWLRSEAEGAGRRKE